MSICCWGTVTVKIQFDNTRTCKYSIIPVLTFRSVTMRPHAFGPPCSEILDPPLWLVCLP